MAKKLRRRARGKGKGGAFERRICKALSAWVSGGKREDLFWRSAMSGGRATVAARRGVSLKAQAGDISAVHSMGEQLTGRFFVECKHRKLQQMDLNAFILKNSGPLWKFWRKAKREARRYGLAPMLIGRGNGMPVFVMVTGGGCSELYGEEAILAHIQLREGNRVFVLDFELLMKTRWAR